MFRIFAAIVILLSMFAISCASDGSLQIKTDRLYGIYEGNDLPVVELAKKVLTTEKHPGFTQCDFLKPIEKEGLAGRYATFLLTRKNGEVWSVEIYAANYRSPYRDKMTITLQPYDSDPIKDKKYWGAGYMIQLTDNGLDSRVDQAQAESKVSPTGSHFAFSDELYTNSELYHNFKWFQDLYEELVPLIIKFYNNP